jgi:hypothetical protein
MKSRRASQSSRPINWRRLVIATLVLHAGLAALVLLAFEVVAPQIGAAAPKSGSGFDYGTLLGSNIVRPLGWYLAGILIALAPVNFLVRVVDLWSGNRGR